MDKIKQNELSLFLVIPELKLHLLHCIEVVVLTLLLVTRMWIFCFSSTGTSDQLSYSNHLREVGMKLNVELEF